MPVLNGCGTQLGIVSKVAKFQFQLQLQTSMGYLRRAGARKAA